MNQSNDDMKIPSTDTLGGWALRQTPAVVILLIAAWLLWGKVEAMENRVSTCNSQMLQLYQTQNDALMRIVSRNADALEQNSASMRNVADVLTTPRKSRTR